MPMTYQELRDQARDGDILFLHVDKRNLLSRTTAWVTGSTLTHAAFLFWYSGRLLVAESTTHGGSRIAVASHYADRQCELMGSNRNWNQLADTALQRSGGTTYGWFSAAYIGVRSWALTHMAVRLPKIDTNRDKACSEYVAEILGFEDPDITPQQLWEQLQ